MNSAPERPLNPDEYPGVPASELPPDSLVFIPADGPGRSPVLSGGFRSSPGTSRSIPANCHDAESVPWAAQSPADRGHPSVPGCSMGVTVNRGRVGRRPQHAGPVPGGMSAPGHRHIEPIPVRLTPVPPPRPSELPFCSEPPEQPRPRPDQEPAHLPLLADPPRQSQSAPHRTLPPCDAEMGPRRAIRMQAHGAPRNPGIPGLRLPRHHPN